MSRPLCHTNDELVAKGLRKPGCDNCIAQENPEDPCYKISHGYKWNGKEWYI